MKSCDDCTELNKKIEERGELPRLAPREGLHVYGPLLLCEEHLHAHKEVDSRQGPCVNCGSITSAGTGRIQYVIDAKSRAWCVNCYAAVLAEATPKIYQMRASIVWRKTLRGLARQMATVALQSADLVGLLDDYEELEKRAAQAQSPKNPYAPYPPIRKNSMWKDRRNAERRVDYLCRDIDVIWFVDAEGRHQYLDVESFFRDFEEVK